ncbi:MAG: DUF11 domain-containing protein, partial [bacterium]|nr:DUF11 domain-containing protein [bacterium]
MNTSHSQYGSRRVGFRLRKGIAAALSLTLSMTTLVVGAFSPTPAAAAPGDGVCYLIADNGGGNGGNDLLTIVDRGDFNPATNETNIGTGTGTNSIEAMDMNPFTLQLFAANANRLGTVDKLTGVFTPLPNTFGSADGASGSIAITDVDGLAFDYLSGVLWGAERQSSNDLLVQIDITTGLIVQDAFGPGVEYLETDIGLLGHDDLDDIAFHPTTGDLYGSITGGGGPGRLVLLDPATGHATDVGPFGTGDIEGMRFDAEGFLWGTSGTSPGELFEINITTGAATNPRTVNNGSDYESTVCYVPGSDLFVDKTVDEPAPYEGTNVVYTVTVFNAGPANATGVVVEDILPTGVTFVSSAPGQGSYDDGTGAWNVGALVRGASATLDIVASVDGGTAGTTITNTAVRIAVDQGDAVPNNDSASVDIIPRAAADLAVNKTTSDSSPSEGDTFTYTIGVTNNGPTGATGVLIADNLPSGVTYVSSAASQGSYNDGSGVWTLGSLAAGASATLDITATVDAGTSLSTITNTASVSGSDQPDPNGSNNSSSTDITIPVAGLEVTKVSDATGPVGAGDTLTYTVTIENTGSMSFTDLVVDDPLPAATAYVDESTLATGWDHQSSSASWDVQSNPNVAFSTNCAAPNVATFPVATSLQLTDLNVGFTATHPWRGDIRVDVISPAGTSVQLAPGAWNGHGQDNYDVIFDAQSTDPLNDGDNDNTAAPYDRSVGVAALANFVGEDTAGTWRVEVCDTYASLDFGTFNSAELFFEGNTDASNPLVLDNAPGGAIADLDDGVPASLVTAADGFDLAPGETMTVVYEVQVDDQLDGSVSEITNTVSVTSDEFSDPVEASVTDPIDFNPELDVVKDGPAGPIAVGDTVTYTYTVTHTAASDGSPVDVTVTDDIIDLSTVTPTGDTDTDSLLDGGETWVYTVDYTVPLATADPLVNVATVTGTDENDEDIPEDTDDHSVDVEFAPLLTVAKVGAPNPAVVGDTVDYTYTVSHAAGSDLSPVSNVAVVDSRGLTLSGPSGDTNSDGLLDGTETWVYTATETVTTTTPDPLTNDVTVNGTDRDDDDIPEATDSESIDIEFAPVVQVDKTGPATAEIGETVTYGFAVSHDPTSDGSPVTITGVIDTIAGTATYVSGDDGDNLLEDGETWIYEASHVITVTDADPLVNVVTVTSTDRDGDPVDDATDNHSTDIEHLPVIVIDKSGPASALVGATVIYTFTVAHDAASDGTPVANLTVIDDVAGSATYVSGDTNSDGFLDAGETWNFTASYTITDTDADPLVNTGTATGEDEDGDPVTDDDIHSTDVIPTASVGDLVWHDLNGDGVVGAGEPGLDGVTVTLYDGLGSVVGTTVTSGGGAYSFADLPPGDYTVDVDESTLPFPGVLSTGNEPYPVTLAEGEDHADADFGYFELASLGDFVWDDLDGNGIQDPGEAGIGGATVVIYDAADLTTPVVTTSTFADGSWSATVAPGDYVVSFSLPGSYVFTPANSGGDDTVDSDADTASGLTASVTVASGETDDTIDAGAYVPVTIGDFVWTDTNGDGNQDGGELGLGGVTVRVFDTLGNEVGSAVTAPDGSYTITLPPGTYDVVVDVTTLPAGNVLTTPGTVNTGALESGDVFETADFGALLPTYPISGTVWNDEDVDTVIDGTEPLLGGVTVELLDDSNNVIATTVTLADGSFSFPPVPDGNYTVSVDEATLPAGMSSTTGNNPEPITVAGAPVTDVDFGYAYPGSVEIVKDPASQQVVTGDSATFTITVTNTGPQDLTNVAVSDPAAPNCNNTIGSLAAGASTSYSCSLANAIADFTNTATVDADDELGNPLTDSDDAIVDVIAPAISIDKTPDLSTVLSGSDVTFTIRVENTGDVELTNVTVSDAATPACDATFASLAAGAIETYTCDATNVTADFTNTAIVTGDHAAAGSVTDNDSAVVDVIGPAITIDKTPDSQQARDGDTVTFDIRVENTGDVVLTDVTVSDAVAPNCDAVFASMAPGAVETYSCSMTAGAVDFTNTASVTGDDPIGNPVADEDSADVDVINPAVTIDKTPDSQQARPGDTVTFDITVSNTGDVELTGVTVTDVLAPSCDNVIGALAAGASTSYSCTMTAGAVDFTNTADVTGDDPNGDSVTDSD